MDNFDNFYGNDDGDNNKEEKRDFIIVSNRDNGEPPHKKERLSKKNIIFIVITLVIALALISNAIILLSFKNDVISRVGAGLAYQAQLEYQKAINGVIDGTNIIEDVTRSASDRTVDRLDTSIGKYVADICLNSVAIINCSSGSTTSTATGFLINDNGERYVLTNEHVVTYDYTTGGFFGETKTAVYSNITCSFYNDTTQYRLTVVEYDSNVDLALCKFSGAAPSATVRPAIKLASENKLSYGEEVVLLGNPEGIGIAMSTGSVSIPSLEIPTWGAFKLVMTDAAVNPGNSGGPMLNKNGVCIGVVESKLVANNIDNMGFAVSIETVLNFLKAYETKANTTIGYKLATV